MNNSQSHQDDEETEDRPQKRSRTPTWEELISMSQVKLVGKKRDVVQEATKMAMTELLPTAQLANECTQELLFIKWVAFLYEKDKKKQLDINRRLDKLSYSGEDPEVKKIRLKQILFDLFFMGLAAMCRVHSMTARELRMNAEVYQKRTRAMNGFMLAVVEAYEERAAFDDIDLKALMKPGQYTRNCTALRSVLDMYGPSGIMLNGACEKAN